MKFIHISDLHIGKRLHETSLIEDQKDILQKILTIIDSEKPDGVIIAGDVYDRTVPSAEAVKLLDDFLASLVTKKLSVFIISGNHDSAERIAFGSSIMSVAKIYLSPVYNGVVTPITMHDEYGEVNVYMLPFIKPIHVKMHYPDVKIESYTDAVRVAIEGMKMDQKKRNVLICHQFVTGSARTESEESVGGLDNVDAEVFDGIDYVALGHLHKAQHAKRPQIRYSGTPLKYSFGEENDQKSLTVINLKEKDAPVEITQIPLTPLREMRTIRGNYEDLLNGEKSDDYVRIILTDEMDVPYAMSNLQTVYKNALELRYDNSRTRNVNTLTALQDVEEKSVYELFEQFFYEMNNKELTETQKNYIKNILEEEGIE